MGDTFLRPARWKVVTALTAGVLACVPLAFDALGKNERLMSGGAGAFWMTALIGFAYAYYASGRYLRFMREGFEVAERFSASSYTLWSDVDEIGIASFSSSARGRLSYQSFAGIKLREGASKAISEDCRKNRAACGYDILLDANYGMALERFVALLKEKKREAEKG